MNRSASTLARHESEAASRRIAIVGAGQSGLPMALALLERGYHVTLMSNRDSDAIAHGKVMSSQCMFQSALQIERDLGLNWWDDTCPLVEGISLAVPHPDQVDEKAIDWAARLDGPALSVDQRLKMAAWLEEAQRRGAHVLFREASVPDLEELTASHDLVLLAAGKGEVVNLFPRDARKSAFDEPQRAVALTYVHGLEPSVDFSRVAFNLIPTLGEYFVFPALTLSGPCHIMVFEGIPGGPMDCWDDVSSPQEHLDRSLALLRTYLPWEFARCSNVELTDANGVLSGRFSPTVRRPVATLPSGRHVFGMGDAVVVHDPITGQGSNSATKCCRIYLDAILAQGDAPFSVDWMRRTFERYWDYAKYVAEWTNTMLMPPSPHILALLAAAAERASLASSIANAFDDPRQVFPWWTDAAECEVFTASHQAT
jgi:2-polyprenyl-6-methoxyphenol hydroxylase-like FAD-dependent oxidoreductase